MTDLVGQDAAELVIPSGLVTDDIAIDRLRAQLDLQPREVSAVVAPIGEAPPGSSFRTVAQRATLQPTSVAFITEEPRDGVALVRDAVEFDVVGRGVRVRGQNVLVDPGAASHDTAAPIGPFDRADAKGRSPFPRAPLVLFMGLEPESGRAIWARDLVNQLFDHGIEARLATISEPAPPHLTRPCRPDRDTVRALQPDIIVTLDDTALVAAPAWCDRRSTVVVHHTGERTLTTELVSWRLGASSGRVRAFIGSAVDAPTLAALCSRLCSGPFPAPPTAAAEDDDGEGPARVRVRVRRPTLQVALVHGPDELSPRLTVFASEAKAQGAVTHTFGASTAMDASDHDVVICAHDLEESVGRALVDTRARRGRKVVVDVVDAAASTALAEHSGRAITPTLAVQEALQAKGVTVRVLPSLLTRSRLDELQRARLVAQDLEENDEPPVLGLIVDTDETERVSAMMGAVAVLLDADQALRVEMLGAGTLSADLRSHPRAATIDSDARPTLSKWRAQAWVGSPSHVARIGRPRPLIEAGYLGVPTVFPADCRGDIDDELVDRGALSAPQDVDQWITGLKTALEGAFDSAALARRSDLLFGAKAGMSIVNRILGWASFAEGAR